jgi:hypothetical protein
MTQRARNLAVILGAAVLAGGAAVGVTAATKPGSARTFTPEGRFGPGPGGGPPPLQQPRPSGATPPTQTR